MCWNPLLPRSLDFCRLSKLMKVLMIKMKVLMIKMNEVDVWEEKNDRGGPRGKTNT